ncbi:DUF4382 domain-containing protein [Alteromonas sp. ASW11-36]|uniref:DUF4382 domain-containing protein n=1 Tax=Alteromonas arenosi TaxID=3055817 RepID=A0ABT7STE0_9ALTE|nr:DUF4382 domain-containing protein [Alteromonas sp. ASW11-36]MDM7859462.1 DUF4382 domain-containing protein [Alteromonas sp. ASW11-36]
MQLSTIFAMTNKQQFRCAALAGCMFGLVACGGSSGGSDSEVVAPSTPQPTLFSLAVSDAPIDEAISVNVYFDQVELVGAAGGPITFDVRDENGDPKMIDLLQVQGADFEPIVTDTEIPSGEYNQLRLSVTDESFIEMESGTFPLRVPSNELKLDGFSALPGFQAAYTVEFDLRKGLVDPVGQDVILLKPRGVRLVANDDVGILSGTVDESLIIATECAVKDDAMAGNAVYVYEGVGLDFANLGDDADAFEGDTEVRPLTIVPVNFNASEQNYEFVAGFVPEGEYTLAFSCLALFDEPESDENAEEGFALQTQDEVTVVATTTTTVVIE